MKMVEIQFEGKNEDKATQEFLNWLKIEDSILEYFASKNLHVDYIHYCNSNIIFYLR